MKKLTIWLVSLVILFGFIGLGLADEHHNYHKHHYHKYLTHINPHFMITADEGYAWHLFKDQGGPTYSGNASWKRFEDFVEQKLIDVGVIDIVKNYWTYDYWSTTEWPGNGDWTLVSDGTPVTVASFGTWSGSTSASGTTAQLVFYDGAGPAPTAASIKDKIVVYKIPPHPAPPYSLSYLNSYTLCDDEYRSDPETFWEMFTKVPPSVNNSYNARWNFFNLNPVIATMKNGQAAGLVVVMDLPYDTVKGLRSHPTPALYQCPTLFLDRVNGSKVIEDAKAGKLATLKLLATVVPKEIYNFVGYLPGRDYGTEKDEMIGVVCHTDGASLTQDNGALGVLAMAQYFSHIPQNERPRTLALYIDTRHMMPGMEPLWLQYDWYAKYPETLPKIKATIGLEHLGELEFREVGEVLEPTGLPEISIVGVDNNQWLIDIAIQSIIENKWPRVELKNGDRPGMHGQYQGSVKSITGLGSWKDLPTIGLAGNWPGGHSQTTSGIDRFDKDLFWTQMAGMSQIVGNLMLVDPIVIDFVWGELRLLIANLPDEAFINKMLASKIRNTLLRKNDAIFSQVESGAYKGAINKLENDLGRHVRNWIIEENQTEVMAKISEAIEKLEATQKK